MTCPIRAARSSAASSAPVARRGWDDADDDETIVVTEYEPDPAFVAVGLSAEAADMTCVACRQGETRPGKTTVVLQRDGATVVINDVPALVCKNCGENYVDQQAAESVWWRGVGLRRRQGRDPQLRGGVSSGSGIGSASDFPEIQKNRRPHPASGLSVHAPQRGGSASLLCPGSAVLLPKS